MRLHCPRPAATVRITVAAALAVTAVLGTSTAAVAHNSLVASDPVSGATLPAPPQAITLTYDQPAFATGSVVRVIGPGGDDVAAAGPVFADRTVRQPLRTGLTAGGYVVQWRVTSADGHPIAGTFSFTVGAASSPSTSATAGAAPAIPGPASAPTPAPADPPSGTPWLLFAVTLAVAATLAAAIGLKVLLTRSPGSKEP